MRRGFHSFWRIILYPHAPESGGGPARGPHFGHAFGVVGGLLRPVAKDYEVGAFRHVGSREAAQGAGCVFGPVVCE